MPRYSYKCINCGHEFTKLVSKENKDGKNISCPNCNKKKLKRVFAGGAAVQTNSSGSSCKGGSCSVCPTCG